MPTPGPFVEVRAADDAMKAWDQPFRPLLSVLGKGATSLDRWSQSSQPAQPPKLDLTLR